MKAAFGPFNRTSMELKHVFCVQEAARYPAFNRTSMELKHCQRADF